MKKKNNNDPGSRKKKTLFATPCGQVIDLIKGGRGGPSEVNRRLLKTATFNTIPIGKDLSPRSDLLEEGGKLIFGEGKKEKSAVAQEPILNSTSPSMKKNLSLFIPWRKVNYHTHMCEREEMYYWPSDSFGPQSRSKTIFFDFSIHT